MQNPKTTAIAADGHGYAQKAPNTDPTALIRAISAALSCGDLMVDPAALGRICPVVDALEALSATPVPLLVLETDKAAELGSLLIGVRDTLRLFADSPNGCSPDALGAAAAVLDQVRIGLGV